MSFSFGGAFGASTPAFGASTPAFGATSTPAFGASTPAFGATSTPAFGASFGAASAPAFGAASAPSFAAFGSPAPAFGAASPAPASFSNFGFNAASAAASSSAFSFSTPSLFGSTPAAVTTSAPAFGSPAPSMFAASAPSFFNTMAGAAGAPQLNPAAMQQQPGLITYSTRYDDLPPDRQKELQDIQREISSYREDCEKLDRDQRLHGSLSVKKSLEEETASLKQSLQGMLNSIRADDEALADFREKVLKLLRSTEFAVRTFQRAKLWRDAPQQYKGQIIPPQVQELLASPVLLPSPYLEQAIQGFQQTLENYRQVIGELEQALPSDIMASLAAQDESSLLQQLPLVISHMHDYFVHVAARMERLHQEVQRNKDLYMSQQRAQGNYSDPFEESKRHLAAAMSPRPDKRGTLTGHNSPPQHYHEVVVHSTPMPGASPVNAGMFGTAAPTPFGTPFGGPISPAAGDMSRGTSARRRK